MSSDNQKLPPGDELARRAELPPEIVFVDADNPEQLAPILVMERLTPGFDHIDAEGKAVSAKGSPVPLWETKTFCQAFDQHHERDAHFVLYGGLDQNGKVLTQFPRMTKPGVFEFLNAGLASSMFGAYLALDYDLPNHGKWDDNAMQFVSELLTKAGENNIIFKHPTVFYRTRGGFRMVWALVDPIPFEGQDGIEDKQQGLIGDAYISGLPVDPACRDAVRLFRLPSVTRVDGEGKDVTYSITNTEPYFSISYSRVDLTAREACPARIVSYKPEVFRSISRHTKADYDKTDVAQKLYGDDWSKRVGIVPKSIHQFAADIDVGTAPPIDQLDVILKKKAGSAVPSFDVDRMKKHLKAMTKRFPQDDNLGRAYRMIFEDVPLFMKPDELDGFHEAVRQCTSVLSRFGQDKESSGSPRLLFALVYDRALASNALRARAGRHDVRTAEALHAEVWDIVSRFWRNDAAKKEAKKQEDEERAANDVLEYADIARSRDFRHRSNVMQMQKYMPELSQEDLQRRLRGWYVVQHRNGYYVLSLDEKNSIFYRWCTSRYENLLSAMSRSGNDIVFEHIKVNINPETGEEGTVFETLATLFEQFGTDVTQARLSRLVDTTQLMMRGGIGDKDLCLVISAPGMEKGGAAVQHPHVEEWFHRLFGDMYEKGMDWLAAFRYIQEPIAALEIRGSPSVGKGMLGLALKNMTASKKYARMDSAFKTFNSTMKETPFIWADEMIDSDGKKIIERIKQLVTGEDNSVHMKFVDELPIDGHWRLLMSTNDADMLATYDVLGEDDLRALAFRFIRVKTGRECADWLESKGGRTFTDGWPEKDIPEHIRWLEEQRLPELLAHRRGKRLLVEGDVTQAETSAFVSNSPRADIVLRAIEHLLHEKFNPETRFPINGQHQYVMRIDAEHDWLMIGASWLAKYIMEAGSSLTGGTKIGAKDIGGILKKMVTTKQQPRRIISGHVTSSYHVLSLSNVIRLLHQNGYRDDLIGNGVVTTEYYKKYLPDLHISIDTTRREHAAMKAAASVNGHAPSTNGHRKPEDTPALMPNSGPGQKQRGFVRRFPRQP